MNIMDYRKHGQFIFVMPEDQLIYADEAYAWCKGHGWEAARFEGPEDYNNAVWFIKKMLPEKAHEFWHVYGEEDGKLRYDTFRPTAEERGLMIDEDNGKYIFGNFICMSPNPKSEQDPFKPKVFGKDVPEVDGTNPGFPGDSNIYPGFPEVNIYPEFPEVDEIKPGFPKVNGTNPGFPKVNNTNQGIPEVNNTGDVSTGNGDILPIENDFSLKDLFSTRDLNLFVLFIVAASLFVVVVALAIALSCVCKKYKKAKAKNTTDASETV